MKELEKLVATEPGAPEFVELAEMLTESAEDRVRAREICFRGLNENPSELRGRLLLARLFYLDEIGEYCARELVELKRRAPELGSVDKLLDALGDIATPYLAKIRDPEMDTLPDIDEPAEDAVVAEVELDEEFVNIMGELEDGE